MTAQDTTRSPRVGDVVATAEQLDALPERSIVRSDDGVWEKVTCQHADGFEHMVWMGSFTEHEAEDVLPRAGEPPVTVVYVPGEQPRPVDGITAGQPGEQPRQAGDRTLPDREALVEAIGHDGEWCNDGEEPDGACCDAGRIADNVLALLRQP